MPRFDVTLPPEVLQVLREKGGKVVIWDDEVQRTIVIKYEDVMNRMINY